MPRAANTYRAQRRAVGKTAHRKNGAGVSANTPRLSNSPVANRMRGFPRNTGPAKYLGMIGNVPGSVRRAKLRRARVVAWLDALLARAEYAA